MEPTIEKETSRDDLLRQGFHPMTQKELLESINGNTVHGDYEYSGHRIYKTFMDPNGEMEAKNDWGSEESGSWSIDEEGCLSVSWEGYWENWTAVAFLIEGKIKFYNIEDGSWQTTFHEVMPGRQALDI